MTKETKNKLEEEKLFDIRIVKLGKMVSDIEFGVTKKPEQQAAAVDLFSALRVEYGRKFKDADEPFEKNQLMYNTMQIHSLGVRLSMAGVDHPVIQQFVNDNNLVEPEMIDRSMRDIMRNAGLSPFLLGMLSEDEITNVEEQLNNIMDAKTVKQEILSIIYDKFIEEISSNFEQATRGILAVMYETKLYPVDLIQVFETFNKHAQKNVKAALHDKSLSAEETATFANALNKNIADTEKFIRILESSILEFGAEPFDPVW